jgi:hypothetical protein
MSFMLSVIYAEMLSVTYMLNVIMLNVVMRSVLILSVVAPLGPVFTTLRFLLNLQMGPIR